MTPIELKNYLFSLISANIRYATMIWGKPGIGKSAIVAQICADNGLDFIDLRLSQLMPSDLRGIPVPEQRQTHWLPPAFLPTGGAGVLFMDEINMAPPALQGVAQQLILDRRVGDYCLPANWFIWAAGNSKSDRAAVFEMPAPLANRFIHLSVEPSLADFKLYAYRQHLASDVIGFLNFRPDLLHQPHPSEPSWPSPRTWEMAANLHSAGLSVAPAVGISVASEFEAFYRLNHELPDIAEILAGSGKIYCPPEPSVRYATVAALVATIEHAEQALNALIWLINSLNEEWVHLYASDLFPRLRELGEYPEFIRLIGQNSQYSDFMRRFVQLIS